MLLEIEGPEPRIAPDRMGLAIRRQCLAHVASVIADVRLYYSASSGWPAKRQRPKIAQGVADGVQFGRSHMVAQACLGEFDLRHPQPRQRLGAEQVCRLDAGDAEGVGRALDLGAGREPPCVAARLPNRIARPGVMKMTALPAFSSAAPIAT